MTLHLTAKQFRRLQAGQAPVLDQKFGNKWVERDGFKFQSVFEADHYEELKLRRAAGEIRNLQVHVPFSLPVNGIEVCRYIADFVYEERTPISTLWGADSRWVQVVTDTKSPPTRRHPLYRLKAKLMRAVHGITIREVNKPHNRSRRRR